MHEVAIDIDEAGAVILAMHQMVCPDLVEQRLRHFTSLGPHIGRAGLAEILSSILRPPPLMGRTRRSERTRYLLKVKPRLPDIFTGEPCFYSLAASTVLSAWTCARSVMRAALPRRPRR